MDVPREGKKHLLKRIVQYICLMIKFRFMVILFVDLV